MFLTKTEYSFDMDKILESYHSIFPNKFDLLETSQVCLNSRLGSPDPYFEAIGKDKHREYGIECPILNEIFRGTYFEEIFNTVGETGRIRFINSEQRSCLSLHHDWEMRYQLAIIPSKGAYLVEQISDMDFKMHNLPADGNVYLLNARDIRHSAINFGTEMRVHLVFCLNKTRETFEEAKKHAPTTL